MGPHPFRSRPKRMILTRGGRLAWHLDDGHGNVSVLLPELPVLDRIGALERPIDDRLHEYGLITPYARYEFNLCRVGPRPEGFRGNADWVRRVLVGHSELKGHADERMVAQGSHLIIEAVVDCDHGESR